MTTDHQDQPARHDTSEEAGAAVLRLLDGLEPLAQRDDTRAFIAGARASTDALTERHAHRGRQRR